MFAPPVAKAQTKAAANLIGTVAVEASSFKQHESHRHNDGASLNAVGAPGVSWDFSETAARPSQSTHEGSSRVRAVIQPKLVVGLANESLEHEADQIADHVMRMPDADLSVTSTLPQLNRKCAVSEGEKQPLLTRMARLSGPAADGAPGIVQDVLRSPGQPLDIGTRSFMEDRLGYDFQHVRVHSDARAAESAAAVNALAYTVGSDVVFGAGQYAPDTARGRHVLAHEMTHVVQQGSGLEHPSLQRFAASEAKQIAPTFQDMVTQIKQLIDAATTNGQLNWDFLVEISGGKSAGRQINKALGSNDPTIKSQLLIRYLFTCRCGLIDMRHFLQLLYISNFATAISQSEYRGNQAATNKGRQHELEAESKSRFAAEDTPSNALGAATNLALPGLPGPDTVFDAIKDTLTRCDPIGWSNLSQASKDQIIQFYGDLVPDPMPRKPGDQIPKNQNETAIPDILPVKECGARERSFPFSLDTSDSDRKTLGGKNFLGGPTSLTSASDIRDFVTTQRPEIIRALPLSEKTRFINILFKWPVRHVDVVAIETIYKYSTADELRAEP